MNHAILEKQSFKYNTNNNIVNQIYIYEDLLLMQVQEKEEILQNYVKMQLKVQKVKKLKSNTLIYMTMTLKDV